MLKTLFAAIAALSLAGLMTGCGMINSVQAIPKKMDDFSAGINKTNDRVDEQAKATAMDGLLKPENRAVISPIPTLMIPYGKMLGELLTADELVQFIQLGIAEINEDYPDHQADANGNDIPYTADQIASINHDKLSRLVGLQIVAGFTPQSTIDQVVSEQIYGGGAYEDCAYALLMLRVQFIRDVMLDAQLLSGKLDNAGLVASAVDWNTKIDSVAKLAFVSRIGIKTTGFLAPDSNVAEAMDPQVAMKYWQKIKTAAQSDFRVSPEALTGNKSQDQGLQQQQQASFNQSMTTINSFLATWVPK